MENSGSPAPLGDKTNTTNGGKQNKPSFYYIIKFNVLFILLLIIKVYGCNTAGSDVGQRKREKRKDSMARNVSREKEQKK
jgi:hypothetical protein